MSRLISHARTEFSILEKKYPDAIVLEFKDEIISLCDKFGNSGQSGGSAPYVCKIIVDALEKLMMFQTISPLTGEEEEWFDTGHSEDGVTMYQNVRNSAVFKDGEDGCPYYIDAVVKKTQSGMCWSGWFWESKKDYLSGNKILMVGPACYIKEFPFTPKTFYIDVIEEEVTKDDWECYMVDPGQLKEVWQYYDKKPLKYISLGD